MRPELGWGAASGCAGAQRGLHQTPPKGAGIVGSVACLSEMTGKTRTGRPADDSLSPASLEVAFVRAFLGGDVNGGQPRREDRQKLAELRPFLLEAARHLPRKRAKSQLVVVDAASGKAALGVFLSALVLQPLGVNHRVVAIDSDASRRALCDAAAAALGVSACVEFQSQAVGDAAWPEAPALVVGLHACGAASDAIIDQCIRTHAQRLLLVPCCYGQGAASHRQLPATGEPPGQRAVARLAELVPLPRAAPMARRFAQVVIEAERVLRLEAAGYHTEVVELFAPTVSPHHLLLRARAVGEPVRKAQAQAQHAQLLRTG